MSKQLTSAFQDLRDRYGITAADLTADELELLVFACKRIESPFSAVNAELMGRPIHVCKGVTFWPPTVGAHVWLTEFADKWWGEGTFLSLWAKAYALMNARNPDAFAHLTDRASARRAVMKTSLRLCRHVREVTRAINEAYGIEQYVVPRHDEGTAERANHDFAALVARLEVASGITKDTWLWGRSFRSVMKSYVELADLSVSAFGGRRDKEQIELDEAVENLARVMAAISERVGKR